MSSDFSVRTAPSSENVGLYPADRKRVLVVDDDASAIEMVRCILPDSAVEVIGVTDRHSALEALVTQRPGLVILDLVMPMVSGMELLEEVLELSPGTDVILMTAHYSTESAVEAIQKGAYDYLTKPLPADRLRNKVLQWLEKQSEERRALELDSEIVDLYQFQGLVGRSPLMLDVFSRIERVAPHFTTALVLGETGTGKELVARALHRGSPAASGPFVVCNCAAVVDTLFESELFGYVRGAFTGATQDKAGFVEHAAGGTLFLDEISEIPISTQSKLLRVIQNREIQRLGSPKTRQVDLRIVAASNRSLLSMVAERTFREDLYYRLAIVQLKLPKLSERREDIPLLLKHFLKHFGERYGKPGLSFTRKAELHLLKHSWPGNVRELENLVNSCCMMSQRDVIDVKDIQENLRAEDEAPVLEVSEGMGQELMSLEEMQLRYVKRVVEQVKGNRARAAAILGIGRSTLYRFLDRLS